MLHSNNILKPELLTIQSCFCKVSLILDCGPSGLEEQPISKIFDHCQIISKSFLMVAISIFAQILRGGDKEITKLDS